VANFGSHPCTVLIGTVKSSIRIRHCPTRVLHYWLKGKMAV